MNIFTLRTQVESTLAGRVSSPFAYHHQKILETASSGIPQIDALTGGVPRGALTEICGPACSGRTTILLAMLRSVISQGEVCALVDERDNFAPASAAHAGVDLRRLLWVRCANLEQALRAADLLLHSGGFGLIALDFSEISPQVMRRVPLSGWFRFRRIIENTTNILIVLEQEPSAKTCASLVLRLSGSAAEWSGKEPWLMQQRKEVRVQIVRREFTSAGQKGSGGPAPWGAEPLQYSGVFQASAIPAFLARWQIL